MMTVSRFGRRPIRPPRRRPPAASRRIVSASDAATLSNCITIGWIWFLLARPWPTMTFSICSAVYSANGRPPETSAVMAAPSTAAANAPGLARMPGIGANDLVGTLKGRLTKLEQACAEPAL